MILSDIKAALLADLNLLVPDDAAQVVFGRVRPEHARSPLIEVGWGGLDDHVGSLGATRAMAEVRFHVRLMLREENSEDGIADLMKAFCDTVRRGESNVRQVTSNQGQKVVERIDIDFSFEDSTEDIAPGWIEAKGSVGIHFAYRQGEM